MTIAVVDRAAALRQRSVELAYRRPLTLAESLVVALIAEGLNYSGVALRYGARANTVKAHAESAADKLLDTGAGRPVDAELERLKPYLRLYTWAHRAG